MPSTKVLLAQIIRFFYTITCLFPDLCQRIDQKKKQNSRRTFNSLSKAARRSCAYSTSTIFFQIQSLNILQPDMRFEVAQTVKWYSKRCVWAKQMLRYRVCLGQSIGCRTHFRLSGNDLGRIQDSFKVWGRGHNPPNFHPVTSISFSHRILSLYFGNINSSKVSVFKTCPKGGHSPTLATH